MTRPRPRPFGSAIRRAAAAFVLLVLALLAAAASAQPLDYQDPVGSAYPTAWPDGAWKAYTINGQPLGDQWSSHDPTTGGTTPNGTVDLVNTPAALYHGDGEVLFMRFRLDGPPLALTGSSQPYVSATWNVLVDVDADGYKEFALMLEGMNAGDASPDDLVVMYNDDPNQSVDRQRDVVWRQDAASHASTPTVGDGESGGSSNWDRDAGSYVWDFGRTRVVQIDEAYAPGSNKSEYFLDFQIPLEVLDATALDGPALDRSSIVRFAITTANSNTNPAQKDFAYLNGYAYGGPGDPLPPGDAIDLEGNGPYLQPVITSIEPVRICSSGAQLTARVSGVTELFASDRIRTVVEEVEFLYKLDPNRNGTLDAGEENGDWTSAGTVTMAADGSVTGGSVDRLLSPWRMPFDGTQFPQGPLLVKVVASDSYFRTTDSLDDDEGSGTYNPATKAAGPVYGSLVNTCGTLPAGLTKTASSAEVDPLGEVAFTLTVANPAGAEPFELTGLRDTLPPGFGGPTVTGGDLAPSGTAYDPSTQVVAWDFVDVTIAPGTSRSLIFTVQAPAESGAYANKAYATTSLGTLESEPVQVGVGEARLGLTVVPSRAQAEPGDPLDYALTYRNDSAINASDVVLTAIVPDEVAVESVSHGGVTDGRTVTWEIGNLPSGDGPHTVTIDTTIANPYPSGGAALLELPATLASAQTSPLTVRGSTYVNAPRASLGLSITELNDRTMVEPGTRVQLDFDYANTGLEAAVDTVLRVPIPAGFDLAGIAQPDAPVITGDATNGYVATWSLGTLAPEEGGTLSLLLDVEAEPELVIGYLQSAGAAPVTDDYLIGLRPDAEASVCDWLTTEWHLTQPDVLTAPLRVTATTDPAPGSTFYIPNGHDYWVSSATVNGIVRDKVFMIVEQDVAATAQMSGEVTSAFYFYKLVGGPIDFEVVLRAHSKEDPTVYHTVDGAVWTDSALGGLTGQPGQPYTLTISPPLDVTGVPEGYVLEFTFKETKANRQSNVKNFHIGGASDPSTFSHCYATPLLVLDKHVDKLTVGAGESLAYTINFNNVGLSHAQGAKVVDTLPPGVAVQSVLRDGAAVPYAQDGRALTIELGTLPAEGAGAGTLEIVVQVDAELPSGVTGFLNHAVLTSDSVGASPVEDTVFTALDRVAEPELNVAKRVSDSLLLSDEVVTYTVELMNSGLVAAEDVTLTDLLPVTGTDASPAYLYAGNASLTLYDAAGDVISPPLTDADGALIPMPSLAPPGAIDGGFGFEIGGDGFALAPGHRWVLSYDMKAGSSVPAGLHEFSSRASATASALDEPVESDDVTVTLSGNPNLRIELEVTPAVGTPAGVGEVLTYTATVWNSGLTPALDVGVAGVLPDLTSYVDDSLAIDGTARTDDPDVDGAAFDPVGSRVTFSLGDLPSGTEHQRTVRWKVRLDDTLPEAEVAIPALATATALNSAYKEGRATIQAAAEPDLRIVKSGPAAAAYPHTTLAQAVEAGTTVTLENTSHVVVGDWVSIGGSVVRVVAIDGAQVTFDYAVTAPSGTPVLPVFEYHLAYANVGTTVATDVRVVDDLDPGLEYISASPSPETAPTSGFSGTVAWSVGDLPIGSGGALTLLARPTSARSYDNEASIESAEVDPETSNVVTTTTGGLTIDKYVVSSTVRRGDSVEYVVTATNTTGSTATIDAMTDYLPNGFTYEGPTNTASGSTALDCTGTPNGGDNVAVWSGCSVPAGASRSVSFSALVGATVEEGVYDNDVFATSTTTTVMQFRGELTTAEDVSVVVGGATVEGHVYYDENLNGVRDVGEDWEEGVTVRVNLIEEGATGVVSLPVEVTKGQGFYRFAGLEPGTEYTIILTDSHASSIPTPPPHWLFTEPDDGERVVSIAEADSTTVGQDFGLYRGTRVVGTVFRDDGYLAGTANDAVRNGGERLLSGVSVTVGDGLNRASVATAGDGRFDFFIPSTWANPIHLEHDGGLTTGVSGGTEVAAPDAFAEAEAYAAAVHTDAGGLLTRHVGVVPPTAFAPDRSDQAPSPGSVSYRHHYTPGTFGGAEFFVDGGLDYELFLDADCDGRISDGERVHQDFVTVDDGWPREPDGTLGTCLVELRVLVPPSVAAGRVDIATLTADLNWSDHSVVDHRTLTDTTIVRERVDLILEATVENTSDGLDGDVSVVSEGKPGENLEYCVFYQNIGVRPLTEVQVNVPVPFHTDFDQDAYGTDRDVKWSRNGTDQLLPADGTAAGLTGRLLNVAVGDLTPAGNGTICFQVTIR